MKLIDFKTFEPLERLRQIMGAEYIPLTSNFNFIGLDEEIEKLLESKGIDIDIKDIQNILCGKDQTIQYKNKRVVLYIRDWPIYSYKNRYSEKERKIHIAHCSTLKQMFAQKKKERYVIASRNDGLFLIQKIRNNQIIKTEEKKLEVCSNCLHTIGWMGYHSQLSDSEKQEIKDRFTLENFFKFYPKNLIDATGIARDEIARNNVYPPNWTYISEKTRKGVNWMCQECCIHLEKHKNFLDVHHIDGNKSNSLSTNLKVLCVECHSKIHSHMQQSDRLRNFITLKKSLFI